MSFRTNRVVSALAIAAVGAVMLAMWFRQTAQPSVDQNAAGPAPLTTDAMYVGSTGCARCHADQSKSWGASEHQQAMQDVSERTVLGNFGGATFTYNGIESTFFRRDSGYWVRTDGPDGVLADFRIRYTFGVFPLQQYLVQFPDGRVQALSIAWDARAAELGGARWFHLYANEGVDFRDELHWTGRLQNWNFMCADCHSTNVRKGYDSNANRFTTSWSEISVGCESCHGPGSRHVQWASSSPWRRRLFWSDNGLTALLNERNGVEWRLDPASAKPVHSTPRQASREIDVCATCHSRRAQVAEGHFAGARLADFYAVSTLAPGLYHPDGQQLDEVYTYGSFLQSRMHAAGVTCSDCHDPHSARLRATGNALCARCHVAAKYDAPTHHFHAAAANSAPSCVSCHMATKTYMGIDARRDHSFRVPRPDRTTALGVPNACAACHAKESPAWAAAAVRRWYGRNAGGSQAFAEPFSAHERDAATPLEGLTAVASDRNLPALVRASAFERMAAAPDGTALETARANFTDNDSTVRRLAIRGFDRIPPRDRLVALPLVSDPVRSVRIEAARVLAPAASLLVGSEDRQKFDRAAAEFVDAERLNADRPEARTNLGTFFIDVGRATEGIAEFRAAIHLDPRYVPAYVNLADAYGRQGQDRAGEAVLRQGLAALPESADLHHALGLSLARSSRYGDSVTELGRAAELRPEVARFSYAHAVALHSTGRSQQAVQVLERARLRHPSDRDLIFALATFHRDAGRREQAQKAAADLLRLFPGDAEATDLLNSLSSTSPR